MSIWPVHILALSTPAIWESSWERELCEVPTGTGPNRTVAKAMLARSGVCSQSRRSLWCGITARAPTTVARNSMTWEFWMVVRAAWSTSSSGVIRVFSSLCVAPGGSALTVCQTRAWTTICARTVTMATSICWSTVFTESHRQIRTSICRLWHLKWRC